MKVSKILLRGLLIACFMPALVESAIIDQQQLLEDGSVAFWGDLPQVQTFTPSMSGQLVKVDLALNESPDTFNEMVHVYIVEWNTNQPGTVLGTSDFFIDDYTGTVDLSSQSIMLVAGSVYGIMLTNDLSYYTPPDPYRNTGISVKWDTDAYPDGSLWTGYNNAAEWQERTGTDVVFTTYMSDMPVDVDIKPGSCPNPFNAKSRGSVPVAIVGTADLDVTTIDPASIILITPSGNVVSALDEYEIKDSTQPYVGDSGDCYDCFDAGDLDNFNCDLDGDGVNDSYCGDGYLDLVVKFDTQELADSIGQVPRDTCIELLLNGMLYTGQVIYGSDSVLTISK